MRVYLTPGLRIYSNFVVNVGVTGTIADLIIDGDASQENGGRVGYCKLMGQRYDHNKEEVLLYFDVNFDPDSGRFWYDDEAGE